MVAIRFISSWQGGRLATILCVRRHTLLTKKVIRLRRMLKYVFDVKYMNERKIIDRSCETRTKMYLLPLLLFTSSSSFAYFFHSRTPTHHGKKKLHRRPHQPSSTPSALLVRELRRKYEHTRTHTQRDVK